MAIVTRGIAPLLQVFELPTSLRFYRDGLGFEVTQTSGQGDNSGWVLLALNGAELMLNTAYEDHDRPAPPDPARVAAHADTAIYFGCPDVDGACAHLRAHGIEVPEPAVTWYGFKAVSLLDPDGYQLCFHWPAK